MSSYFLGESKCYISALLGSNMLLRIDDGYLTRVEDNPIYNIPPHVRVSNIEGALFPRKCIGTNLNLHVMTKSYTITKFDDGLASMPIRDKRVDDCSVEELLYAIQSKMGIV
jgi:hypothetical protein